MTEWFYRATPTKVSFEETRGLAVEQGFICRSAYEENTSRADNTQHVKHGDVLHVYFTGDGQPRIIGSFQVVGRAKHPHPDRFGKGVPGTALHEVSDDFERQLAALGDAGSERYQRDPVKKKITGWFVLRRSDLSTPPFDVARFSGRSSLVR